MRKILLLCLASSLILAANAQLDTVALKQAAERLDKALVEKDSAALYLLLDKKLGYGHSNGWVQSRDDVWNDFRTGKTECRKIENQPATITVLGKEWAAIRYNTRIDGTLGEKVFSVKLHVLQVWKLEKKGWQLVQRQATKIEN